jgi:hypothetical protein
MNIGFVLLLGIAATLIIWRIYVSVKRAKSVHLAICTDRPNVSIESWARSPQDVINAIESLDNVRHTGVLLSRSVGLLFIFGVNQNRAWVTFAGRSSRHNRRHGTLVDEAYSEEDGEIDISVSGEITPIPLYATASKELTTSVAVHFLEHAEFPHDVRWLGNMK